ncbi:hypothetical protein J2X36_004649 [Methylobacterium sp. BE186]|uniref:hypothetical protein n=1 Tax=Methylobacterium sp. BE186 TaxID=2817715 RepID=UPI00285B5F72|nr:hypothetical protein [Methylobacterium sp. BE186]MDR7039871.1 hypothetical protein [Methylobacterium sp. BE186]
MWTAEVVDQLEVHQDQFWVRSPCDLEEHELIRLHGPAIVDGAVRDVVGVISYAGGSAPTKKGDLILIQVMPLTD